MSERKCCQRGSNLMTKLGQEEDKITLIGLACRWEIISSQIQYMGENWGRLLKPIMPLCSSIHFLCWIAVTVRDARRPLFPSTCSTSFFSWEILRRSLAKKGFVTTSAYLGLPRRVSTWLNTPRISPRRGFYYRHPNQMLALTDKQTASNNEATVVNQAPSGHLSYSPMGTLPQMQICRRENNFSSKKKKKKSFRSFSSDIAVNTHTILLHLVSALMLSLSSLFTSMQTQ